MHLLFLGFCHPIASMGLHGVSVGLLNYELPCINYIGICTNSKQTYFGLIYELASLMASKNCVPKSATDYSKEVNMIFFKNKPLFSNWDKIMVSSEERRNALSKMFVIRMFSYNVTDVKVNLLMMPKKWVPLKDEINLRSQVLDVIWYVKTGGKLICVQKFQGKYEGEPKKPNNA